tara:strand:+ start:215 stop:1237 length:1023 start_codon:yes stop_codon:yes gene_type:complete
MSKKNSIVLNHKNCFSNSEQISYIYSDFKKKILKLKTNKFLVAVSGGPDSLALAAMCKAFETNYKKKKFYYIHINHGLRKNSQSESSQVKEILKKQHILLKVINNKKKIINNIQHNARKVRYSLLSNECKKKKIKFILTGHHKEDQIETFLIRLSRGSGVQGLSAMNTTTLIKNNIKVFRPFLDNSKKNLIFVTKKVFGTYIKDPSNNDKKFLRSKIRKLLPILNKYGINENQIIRSINNLKSSSKTINIHFKEVFKKVVKQKEKKIFIKKNNLFSLNEELQIKILGHIIKSLKKSDYPPRSKKILNALKFLNSARETKHQLGGCLLINRNNHIYVEKSL